MAPFQHIDVRKNGEVYAIRFRDSRILDDMVIEKVSRELYQVAEQDDCKNVLVNFSGVGFLSSSMLGKLITLNKRLKAKDAKLKLCEMAPEIRQLFDLTGLVKVFDIRGDETAGLLAFYDK